MFSNVNLREIKQKACDKDGLVAFLLTDGKKFYVEVHNYINGNKIKQEYESEEPALKLYNTL